ncbi:MAG: hypothetical protein AAB662_03830 [Patescibacteria group bacterium]
MKRKLSAFILIAITVLVLFAVFLYLNTRSNTAVSNSANQSELVTPTEAPELYPRDCINKGSQIEVPSKYAVHVFRRATCMPDISLEKVRIVGIAFFAKGVDSSYDVRRPIEGILKNTGSFWERALDYKTKIRTEFLPIEVRGSKYANEYSPDQITLEIEKELNNKLKDRDLSNKIVTIFKQNRSEKIYKPSAEEFLVVVIFAISHAAITENIPAFNFVDSAVIGIAFVPLEIEPLMTWPKISYENVVAHEVGHTFGLPDQYWFAGNEWYDPDPKNIMGLNSWKPLSQLYLSDMVKKWSMNKVK